jgi:hypothetical protein
MIHSRKFLVVAGAAMLLGLAPFITPDRGPSPLPQGEDRESPVAERRAPAPPRAELPAPRHSPFSGDSAEHRAWVKERSDELYDLSWFDDDDSLRAILAELANPDPELRAAAVEATLNFGSRDAIPHLVAAAARAEDPEERARLEEVAAHLRLPTATEFAAERAALREAGR